MKRGAVVGAAVGAALVSPGAALAHGKSAPVATNFAARLTGIEPPTDAFSAKVVDGDRDLWVKAAPAATILVPGAAGEPLLLFDRRGVFVNVRSPTAQSDRIDPFDLRPVGDPSAQPVWHRLTGDHTYRWHEHRLHALEPLARGRGSGTLGSFAVPFRIDGRTHLLHGTLAYRQPGTALPWYGLALAFAAAAAFVRRFGLAAGAAAALAVWTVRVARELYGRPGVSRLDYLQVGLTSAVGVALLAAMVRRDQAVRELAVLLIGVGGAYQGLTMLPVLRDATALTLLPTTLARIGVAAALGLGCGLVVLTLRTKVAS